jgi:hypothetical protein
MMLIFVLRKIQGVESGEWGLRIADCGFMNLFNREREIGSESFINPRSAIRNPQSALPIEEAAILAR